MNLYKVVSAGTLFLVGLLFSVCSFAESAVFEPQKFIDIASVRCFSEIATAKIALQKSSSPEVKVYAEAMITDYTDTLSGLRNLAQKANLHMPSDVELQSNAHVYIFERKGATFDSAYADMRMVERRKTVSLFREAIASQDVLSKEYAEKTLPLLMHDLYMAQTLVEALAKNKASMIASN